MKESGPLLSHQSWDRAAPTISHLPVHLGPHCFPRAGVLPSASSPGPTGISQGCNWPRASYWQCSSLVMTPSLRLFWGSRTLYTTDSGLMEEKKKENFWSNMLTVSNLFFYLLPSKFNLKIYFYLTELWLQGLYFPSFLLSMDDMFKIVPWHFSTSDLLQILFQYLKFKLSRQLKSKKTITFETNSRG